MNTVNSKSASFGLAKSESLKYLQHVCDCFSELRSVTRVGNRIAKEREFNPTTELFPFQMEKEMQLSQCFQVFGVIRKSVNHVL